MVRTSKLSPFGEFWEGLENLEKIVQGSTVAEQTLWHFKGLVRINVLQSLSPYLPDRSNAFILQTLALLQRCYDGWRSLHLRCDSLAEWELQEKRVLWYILREAETSGIIYPFAGAWLRGGLQEITEAPPREAPNLIAVPGPDPEPEPTFWKRLFTFRPKPGVEATPATQEPEWPSLKPTPPVLLRNKLDSYVALPKSGDDIPKLEFLAKFQSKLDRLYRRIRLNYLDEQEACWFTLPLIEEVWDNWRAVHEEILETGVPSLELKEEAEAYYLILSMAKDAGLIVNFDDVGVQLEERMEYMVTNYGTWTPSADIPRLIKVLTYLRRHAVPEFVSKDVALSLWKAGAVALHCYRTSESERVFGYTDRDNFDDYLKQIHHTWKQLGKPKTRDDKIRYDQFCFVLEGAKQAGIISSYNTLSGLVFTETATNTN